MKRIFGILICLCVLGITVAQSNKTIVEKKITKRVTTETNYADGLNKPLVEEERVFDERANILELKEYGSDGKIKTWMKYEYDAENNLITEMTINTKGKIEEKIVYIYKDGLRIEKQYFDAKDRLTKKKTYEYSYSK